MRWPSWWPLSSASAQLVHSISLVVRVGPEFTVCWRLGGRAEFVPAHFEAISAPPATPLHPVAPLIRAISIIWTQRTGNRGVFSRGFRAGCSSLDGLPLRSPLQLPPLTLPRAILLPSRLTSCPPQRPSSPMSTTRCRTAGPTRFVELSLLLVGALGPYPLPFRPGPQVCREPWRGAARGPHRELALRGAMPTRLCWLLALVGCQLPLLLLLLLP